MQHLFTHVFSRPVLTSFFLFVNGLILLAGERMRRRGAQTEAEQIAADTAVASGAAAGRRRRRRWRCRRARCRRARRRRARAGQQRRHSSGPRAARQQEAYLAVEADRRLTGIGFRGGLLLGSSQILALLPGISRDGIVMVSGMFKGLTRQDAARFSFLLSAPVILAAGVFKLPDLTGPLGHGIRGPVLFGSLLSGIGAYLALRFLVRYFSDPSRTLTPFAIYCLAAGLGSAIYLTVR